MTDLCEGGMDDLWSITTLLLQVWFSVMIGLIMIPAMFGLSLGVTSVYIQILVKILEWATLRIQRGHRDRPTLPVPAPLPNGLIQREGGSMEQEMGELRRYRTQSISRGEFALSDSFYFYRKGLESIVDDQVTQRFSSEELVSWNLLTRTNHNFHYISLRLTVIWGLGVIIRYCVLFPLRITLAIIGISWLVIGTTLVGFLPNRRVKNWLSELVHLMCYRICARGLSATIQYHNKNNKPQKGGICVANHTSPIDIVILANDGCYAMVGQSHSGLMGVIQRSMVRSCPHVWFERSEMRDRHAVTSRLRAHVAAKRNLPILIFPEGTCINNTSVMMFKKGSFEIGGTIYPVAIKYDPRFGDAFWNSAKYNMVSYLLRMMTSWAIVVNVWYLPPMTRQEGEDATKFANRVKSAIAHQGGLLDMAWDGSLKRDKVKEEFKEHQQKMYSSMVVGKKARNSQEPHTESSKS
ncbi:glycerol-3-phosphate acyltransferase 3 isoform X1 [Oncorhynchus tshawytscha]|uniref:glycerol-3-phosphate acyltransferase 3 isoform X1 n=2 Tax=Oncorhynchus TaxID=8016 RepID=UPI000D09B12F|nr:glycerol-3-phosphate acyltransferase 3 isoform X1 [Oncorhynchus tshawytscha]XP_024286915.1 glycerol-3-phosphate acyltransferase 3 isoform X1 [Oncorhynchus tshawytscha]XP_024286916.1 glycerol-3-phosphate acyltransferase 3 isoform X1 [Oncorhynchus tshawytscha]XP_024286917.1 glycerol-3-phosphate acyltransferase 3 isoform X1 [Oncorhynchus tshawytscha]